MPSDTSRVAHSNQLQEQLAALQNEVAELSIQFHHNGRNRRSDNTRAKEDTDEFDRVSMTCEKDSGEYDGNNGTCQDSTQNIRIHAIAGSPDPIWTCEEQNRIDSNHDKDVDHVGRCTTTSNMDKSDVSPVRSMQVPQIWSENNHISSATHTMTMDSFSSIPERTTQMISDLANTKKLLHQVRRERDMYLIQFQDERTKLQELTQKYTSLFEATERSNASLRMHLNTKEDVCQRQAELIRFLQESTQGVIIKSTGISHTRHDSDQVTLPTASSTNSISTTVDSLSSIRSNRLKASKSQQAIGRSSDIESTTTSTRSPHQHKDDEKNETTKGPTKKKMRSRPRKIPARSRQTIFSSC